MSRLVIVLPLAPLAVGESFAVHSWPLHVTVLPPFLTTAEPEQIARALADASVGLPAITATAGADELFGRRHNVPVTVLEENPELTALHRALRAAVLPFATEPDEPAFTGPGYRPHVTVKQDRRVEPGQLLTLGQLAVVDMAPRAHPAGRTVLATLDLGTPAGS
ncbi:2'-5' RNA ligase family protein [Microterricola viridarii]|uniref:2'-5' RNA ligase superfamily protein n=1 Tax=Microterricola viridarii TaxID=412690 RepID=A0A1H1M825_9MICO|nr:2'-5' RNA ligase family protein [Microterricola viridarii]SDR82908.1 2'-5' RNA ligase superfamily protein [Microterricola viridarii]